MDRPVAQQPILLAAALWLGAAATGLWWCRHERAEALRTAVALAGKIQERDALARIVPAPSAENEKAIAEDVATAQAALGALQSVLRAPESEAPSASVPATPIDAFFDLAGLVESLRAKAALARVQVRPDERFGFAAQANEGPAPSAIAVVHRQRVAVQTLIEALLEARPLALLGVWRERPETAGTTGPAGKADDFFTPDPAILLRRPAQVESLAFRLEFTGQTAALRNFLNALAEFRPAVVVHSIEVESLAGEKTAPARTDAGARAASAVPLVQQNLSRFALVVEFVVPVEASS